MQTIADIRRLLEERGLRPKHRLGQNFLHDQNQLRKLLDAADVSPDDLILEVGPGTGTLTEALVERGAEVIACEIDPDMASIVESRLGGRITLIRADVLAGKHELNTDVLDAVADRRFKLVANLPYGVASPLMINLLVAVPHCTGQFVTIQKEVAERITADPGTKAYGPLTVVIRALADVEHIATLSPRCFWPPPQVTSAMIAIRPRPGHGIDDPRGFARFVSGLFSRRRKQLGSVLGRDAPLPEGVSHDQRPESLTASQFREFWRLQSHP